MKTPVSLLFCPNDTHITEETPASLPHESVQALGWQELQVQAEHCQQCGLARTRTHLVFGEGDKHADTLWIGDAPNASDKQIYTDDAGELFAAMLQAMGLAPQHIYCTPMIQCNTPEHRAPDTSELEACRTWLKQKIQHIQPKVIILTGRMAAQGLLGSDASLKDLRGRWHSYQNIPTRVTYHPAYLLRSPRQKQEAWKDLQAIQQKLQTE